MVPLWLAASRGVGGLALDEKTLGGVLAATSVLMLAVLVVLGGLATGATRPVANTLIARIVDEGDRGKAFGVMSSASALGWAMGPMAGGYMGAHYGFRSVFVATSILFLAVGGWAWVSMKGIGVPRGQGTPR